LIRSTPRSNAPLAILAALLLAGLAGCATSPRADPLSADEARQQVTEAELGFARSMANRDLAAFGRFIAEDAVFFSGKEPLRGRDAIIRAWTPFFAATEAPFSWAPDKVEISAGGTLGLTSGPVQSSAGTPTGRFTSIWQRQTDGAWRVVFDAGSDD
jgi:ketosteroid isomerase-like protein